MASYKQILGQGHAASSYRAGVPDERDRPGFVIAAARKYGACLPALAAVGASAADARDTRGHVAVPLGRVSEGWPLVHDGASDTAARTRWERTLARVFRPPFAIVPAFDTD